VTNLTALDTRFSEGNVLLGALLGALAALSTVRSVLPEASDVTRSETPSTGSIDTAVAFALGVVAMHERLTTLVNPRGADAPGDEDAILPAASVMGLSR
jgi:hypothetical protein